MPNRYELASQRIEHAMRRFQASWGRRDLQAISRSLDELDVAVELWLDLHEVAASLDDVAEEAEESGF